MVVLTTNSKLTVDLSWFNIINHLDGCYNPKCGLSELQIFQPKNLGCFYPDVFTVKFGRVSSAVKPAILHYFYKDLTGKHIYIVINII